MSPQKKCCGDLPEKHCFLVKCLPFLNGQNLKVILKQNFGEGTKGSNVSDVSALTLTTKDISRRVGSKLAPIFDSSNLVMINVL